MRKLMAWIGSVLIGIGIIGYVGSVSARKYIDTDFSKSLVKELQSKDYVNKILSELDIDPQLKPTMEELLITVMENEVVEQKTQQYLNAIIHSFVGDEIEVPPINEDIKTVIMDNEEIVYQMTQYTMSREATHQALNEIASMVDLEQIYEKEFATFKANLPESYQNVLSMMHFVYSGTLEKISLTLVIIGVMIVVISIMHPYRFLFYIGNGALFGAICLFVCGKLMPNLLNDQMTSYQYISGMGNVLFEQLATDALYLFGIAVGFYVVYGILCTVCSKKAV